MTRRRIPRPRLRCPVCDGAPRLPADLRRELRCQSGARLRVALGNGFSVGLYRDYYAKKQKRGGAGSRTVCRSRAPTRGIGWAPRPRGPR